MPTKADPPGGAATSPFTFAPPPPPPYPQASPFSSSHIPARHWTVENVIAWMSILEPDLGQYAGLFRNNDINGPVLLNLTNETLRDELGVRSYGHRQRLLSEIHNIQRSTDFPPLSASRPLGGRRGSTAERQRVELRLIVTYVHDVKRHSWRVLLAPEAKIATDYLSQVDFVLSIEAGRNEAQVTSKPPFEYCGMCDPAEGAELSFTVHFRQHEFRRSFVQHAIRIDGRERREIVVARLLPRPGMRQQVFSILPIAEGLGLNVEEDTFASAQADRRSGHLSPGSAGGAGGLLSRGVSVASGGTGQASSSNEHSPRASQETLKPADLDRARALFPAAGRGHATGVPPEEVAGALAKLTLENLEQVGRSQASRPRTASNASATSSISVSSRRDGTATPGSVASSSRRSRGASAGGGGGGGGGGAGAALASHAPGGVSPSSYRYGPGRQPLFNAWSSGRNPVTGGPSKPPPQLSIGSFASPSPSEVEKRSPVLAGAAPQPIPPESFGTPVTPPRGRGRGQPPADARGAGGAKGAGVTRPARRGSSSSGAPSSATPASPGVPTSPLSPRAPPIDDDGWAAAPAQRGRRGSKSKGPPKKSRRGK